MPTAIAGLNRRRALQLACGAVLAPALAKPFSPAWAQAQPSRIPFGEFELLVVSDGTMDLPTSMVLPGHEPGEIQSALGLPAAAPAAIKVQLNVTLVRRPGVAILVDTGGGTDFLPGLGAAPDALEAAGINPDEITHVLFTHAHPDHLWGVIDPLDGGSRFQNARLLMSAAERDYWLRPGIETEVPEALRGMTAGTARRLAKLADRIDIVAAGTEISPGCEIVATPGHTPGHISLALHANADTLVVGGDALTHPVVSFQFPDWRWGTDVDAALAVATRRRLLDRLATERTRLLGYHLPWPGLGAVERTGAAFLFVLA